MNTKQLDHPNRLKPSKKRVYSKDENSKSPEKSSAASGPGFSGTCK